MAEGAEKGARSQNQKVEALLDWMAAAGMSIMGLQETGWGGAPQAMSGVQGAVRRWAKQRGRQAGVWMTGRPGLRKSGGGAKAGVAILVLGDWAAKVQTVRRWKSGRMVSVELQLGSNQVVWVASAYTPTGQGATNVQK